MPDTPEHPPLRRSMTVTQGEPLTVPALHVEYDPEHGYRVVPGIGRQASTAGAAR